MRLKRLLRENGISWSPIASAFLTQHTKHGRVTRSSTAAPSSRLPFLPVEVLLRILSYALTSDSPIIDPMSKLRFDSITNDEKTKGNQIAIHFLSTCKAMHAEGTKIFWSQNTFIFTNHVALRNLCHLDPVHRSSIRRLTFRIIAQFYDDGKTTHVLERSYHPGMKRDVVLPIRIRANEEGYARGGLRCYSWSQVIDFLHALRPPWDPKHDKKQTRPRLLPNLTSLRIDLVNFDEERMPMFSHELHNMASHEMGCILDELYVTGIPVDDVGIKASTELTGLLKDEGLYLTGVATFFQAARRGLVSLNGTTCSSRMIRAWKTSSSHHHHHHHLDDSDDSDDNMDDFHPFGLFDDMPPLGLHHGIPPLMPPAPSEPGHPKTAPERMNRTLWRRVPVSRDSSERRWVEFCRTSGYPVENLRRVSNDDDSDDYDDEQNLCPCCGGSHPGSGSLLDILMDEAD